MPTLSIDGREVRVHEGTSVLHAARQAGIEIPSLCCIDGCHAFSSCMVCVVRDESGGRLIPSCAAPAAEGMRIRTDSVEVRDARRTAVELLLSEHVGDCEAPCRRACPAHMDIPTMIRQIGDARLDAAVATVREDIALPAVLGRICPAPCEKACRRAKTDAPVAVCLLKRFAGDSGLAGAHGVGGGVAPTGKRVAVVGAGPAGLAAAYHIAQQGHRCVVIDRAFSAGGALRSAVSEALLPRDVLDAEIEVIRSAGVEFLLEVTVGHDVFLDELVAEHDAVVLALGPVAEAGVAAIPGLGTTDAGIEADRGTLATSMAGVFAVGSAVRVTRLAVRAVAQGRTVASSVDQYLAGAPVTGRPRPFDCRVGQLDDAEQREYMQVALDVARVQPSASGPHPGFTPEEAEREAARCMQCDCRAASACRLRDAADLLGADQARYRGEQRRPLVRVMQHAGVVYEPGKCIKCGLCIQITRRAKEPLGLAFLGRGFDLRVGVPFGDSLAAGLRATAVQCVEACPTGALALKGGRDPDAEGDGVRPDQTTGSP